MQAARPIRGLYGKSYRRLCLLNDEDLFSIKFILKYICTEMLKSSYLRRMKKRQNTFLLFEPPVDPWNFPSKVGYSYMNRFTIDEDAAFELIGVDHLSETSVIKHI